MANGKAGRPKGAGNKDIEHLRKEVEKLVTRNREKLDEALEMMRLDNPKDFVMAYVKILEFVIPKAVSKVEHSVDDKTLNKISINIVSKEANGDQPTSN